MIRRMISLLLGGVACWALYALIAKYVMETTPAALILGADTNIWSAILPACAGFLLVHFLLARVGIFKRGWMSTGAMAVALLLCLFAMVFYGGLNAG